MTEILSQYRDFIDDKGTHATEALVALDGGHVAAGLTVCDKLLVSIYALVAESSEARRDIVRKEIAAAKKTIYRLRKAIDTLEDGLKKAEERICA